MNKRNFEKVLHEKGTEIALHCIRWGVKFLTLWMILGIVELLITGSASLHIGKVIIWCGAVAVVTFVVLFLMEVYLQSKK